MKNLVVEGNNIQLKAPANITGGSLQVFSERVFCAITDIASGAEGAYKKNGVISYPKATSDVVAVGDVLYFNSVNNVVQKTQSTFKKVGSALSAHGGSEGEVYVDLHP